MREMLSLVLVLGCCYSQAATRIIYGEDSRTDVKNIYNAKLRDISKSVAGRIDNYAINHLSTNPNSVSFEQILKLSHPRSLNVCEDEKFANQPTVADCTGFLVADNLLVTAGHCAVRMGQTVRNKSTFSCDSHSWIFDYKMGSSSSPLDLKRYPSDKIYSCKKVIYGTWQEDDDYAIIELDRKVVGRTPLKMNTKRNIKAGTDLFIMGHPSGLPLKYAEGAKSFEITENYFTTNLDSFGGNSGSPVFLSLIHI